MGTSFEKRCEAYKKELEKFLTDYRITITEYCRELNNSFVIDILFPKTEEELRDAKTSFDVYRTIFEEVSFNSLDLSENTAYLLNIMGIDALDQRTLYSEIEETMYLVATNKKARARFELDSIKMMMSDRASDEIIQKIIIKAKSLEQAEKIFHAYTNNLMLAEAKSIKRAIREQPSVMMERLYSESDDDTPGIKGYISSKKSIYEYIISNSNPQFKRKIEKK